MTRSDQPCDIELHVPPDDSLTGQHDSLTGQLIKLSLVIISDKCTALGLEIGSRAARYPSGRGAA
jgi:hypothetical protein